MGDPRRFTVFSQLIAGRFPDRTLSIADVAGGKGRLQASLRQIGFKSIVSWDTRHSYASGRRFYKYGLFDYRTAPPSYDLVIGMHPDGGTDHIICYAAKNRIPFAVCPCCPIASACAYDDGWNYVLWMRHLRSIAKRAGMFVEDLQLPITGRNKVIVGTPGAAAKRKEAA